MIESILNSPALRARFSLSAPAPAVAEGISASRYDLLCRHGDFTMAPATLQPGMKYFDHHDGYIAFDRCWGTNYVLGDPIVAPHRRAEIISAYLQAFPRSCFCQVSRPVAEILQQHGHYLNELGTDQELDLKTYDFTGPGKSKLRQAANKIAREGFRVVEFPEAELDQNALLKLESTWVTSRRIRRELRFLARPLVMPLEPHVRRFYLLDPGGEIVAFIFFDPIYSNGQVTGYSSAVKRRSPASPTGSEEAITKFAIDRFKAEGRSTLRFGLLPLHQVDDQEFRHRKLVKHVFQFLYRNGNSWVYNFQGQADFKHRYRGEFPKVYVSFYSGYTYHTLIGLLRLCRYV
jgi:lysylphosphatidylglycerol synthetase-like protein (DUF2156 family)